MATTTPRSRRKIAVSVVSLLAVPTLMLSACGSDGSAAADTGSPTTAAAAPSTSSTHDSMAMPEDASPAEVQLYSAMRTLWAQHMEWTYSAIVAFASNEPAVQPTIDRLLRNQDDIGKAIEPFYGADASKKLTQLLRAHIEDAVPVLQAAKAGDTDALNAAVDAWYANAQEIADFLASANPAWEQTAVREMMKTHITQTVAYASDVLKGDYTAAIQKFDEAEAHMMQMADALSQGVVTQFPDKF